MCGLYTREINLNPYLLYSQHNPSHNKLWTTKKKTVTNTLSHRNASMNPTIKMHICPLRRLYLHVRWSSQKSNHRNHKINHTKKAMVERPDIPKEPTETPVAEDEAPGTQPLAPTDSSVSDATPSKYSPCTATRTSWIWIFRVHRSSRWG